MLTLCYMPNTSSVLHLHPTLVPLLFVQSPSLFLELFITQYSSTVHIGITMSGPAL